MFNATHEAMAKAEGFVLQMKQAKNLRQFEDAWKDYLGALQRTWNKLGSEAKKIARVHAGTPAAAQVGPALKAISRTINDDPLLNYLKHARDSDEHTVEPITTNVGATLTVTAIQRPVHVRGILVVGDQLVPDADGPLSTAFSPARMILLQVLDKRGRRTDVPTTHLGKPVSYEDVVAVAQLGLEFCKSSAARVEALLA